MWTFWKETIFCSDGFQLVSYLFLLRPVHTLQLVSYHSFFYCPETKEIIYESVNLKGDMYKTLSAFSLLLIYWALNKILIELNTKLVQSLVNRFYYCIVKRVTFHKRIFINDLIDSSVQLISQQPGYEKHVADWCCKCKTCIFWGSSISEFYTEMAVRKHWIFRQFQTEIIKSHGLRQNITLSKHWPPTNKLFGSLDWFLTLETSGIGKNEKSLLHNHFPHFIQKLSQSHVIFDV